MLVWDELHARLLGTPTCVFLQSTEPHEARLGLARYCAAQGDAAKRICWTLLTGFHITGLPLDQV